MVSDATLSACGTYRYRLTRTWGEARPLTYVMLNPSTADASVDDPTIRRCVGFARSSDYGGIVVVNLFALRATDPGELEGAADPVGPENDYHLYRAAAEAAERGGGVVLAWGAEPYKAKRPVVRLRPHEVLRKFTAVGVPVYALSVTKAGYPAHPLYLKGACVPMPYTQSRP